jgi:hypothetical protein
MDDMLKDVYYRNGSASPNSKQAMERLWIAKEVCQRHSYVPACSGSVRGSERVRSKRGFLDEMPITVESEDCMISRRWLSNTTIYIEPMNSRGDITSSSGTKLESRSNCNSIILSTYL